MHRIRSLGLALIVGGGAIGPLRAQAAARPLPLKYAGPPTTAAITPGDLMTRLYQFSDDSMMGRALGTEAHLRATDYLAREAQRLGLQPGGAQGTFFQDLPVFARGFDVASTITVGDVVFHGGVDFLAASSGTTIGAPMQLTGLDAIYGGVVFDTTAVLPGEQVRGKVLVLHTGPPPSGSQTGFINSAGYQAWRAMLASAAAVMTIDGDQIPASALRGATVPSGIIWRSDSTTTVSFGITTRLAEAIFHSPFGAMATGASGRITGSMIRFTDVPRPARNVIAILPGSDPALRGEYVVLGAPNDHLAPFGRSDHDSLRIVNQVTRPLGAISAPVRPTEAQMQRIRTALDSVRRVRAPRVDSIYNGADEGGSGAVALLEVAESLAGGTARPRRSVLFIWHAGELMGLRGSEYFVTHSTVPRDSLVAELNLTAIGRGDSTDVTGVTAAGAIIRGGPRYLQVVGSRRQSSQFGTLLGTVDREGGFGLDLDYSLDVPGHPLGLLCRSDQWNYARFGIPVAFLTTGSNSDFHQVTDEAQYVDYPHLTEVTRFVAAVVLRLADLDQRPILDQPRPDPAARCRQ